MSEQRAHGGRRRGAGRRPSGRKRGGPHRVRPVLSSRHPVHVTLRTLREVPRLRQRCMYHALRRVLLRYLGGTRFRVVHISIQHNHLHMLVEAQNTRELTRGMQSFAINAARAINAAWGRIGKVFAGRYHASQIKTARYARRALAYVMNNWRRHREDLATARCLAAKLDPYSSALAFPGWTQRFACPDGHSMLPVSPPATHLLKEGWSAFGRIDPFGVPGPLA